MARSIPQLISIVAALVGVALFLTTLYVIDLDETVASISRLGAALPIVLVPGTAWHLLRTWGWSIAFPDEYRPAFTRVFRVRLAADAIGFFTVRGVAGEPLKVVLLYDRVPPEVTTAAVALERLAFAVIAIVVAGMVSLLALAHLTMPSAWDTLFSLLAAGAVIVIASVAFIARRGSEYYGGALIGLLDRITGRHLERHRIVRFILDVERVLLALLRGNRRRLVVLTILPIVGYALMTLEVWLVFWAIGRPMSVTEALTVETFARLASIATAMVPGNIGTLEASNVAVVEALDLAGGGSLALARRIRSLLWAGLGLALYPRVRPGPVRPN